MSTQRLCILLVDDEPANLILLENLLAAEGYTTLSATSGWEALELAEKSQPDLVLLDIMMPDMDGFEVCDRFRKDETLKTVPVIFLTALTDEQSMLKAMEIMGDDYITKPFNSRLLLAKIASTLQLTRIRTQTSNSTINQKLQDLTHRQLAIALQINEYIYEKFRLFVPEQFLKRIAPQGIDSIQLGNVAEEELTVLFCDIRGYTAIAESQNARETFEWLNAFFNQMSSCINSNHGFIDKYLGDAIMAVFDRDQVHAYDALNAALMMKKSIKEFNQTCYRYSLESPIHIGIGINTGIGMIGTLGSEHRMDSTVIGDVVNTASRLESLTKVYGCNILVSQKTIDAIEKISFKPLDVENTTEFNQQFNPDFYYYRWIDKVQPRGKNQVVDIYELLGSKTYLLSPKKVANSTLFQQGIKAWKAQDFSKALTFFENIVKNHEQDYVANFYLEKCQQELFFTVKK